MIYTWKLEQLGRHNTIITKEMCVHTGEGCVCVHGHVRVSLCERVLTHVQKWGGVRREPWVFSLGGCPLDFRRRVLQGDIRLSDPNRLVEQGTLQSRLPLSPQHQTSIHLPQYTGFTPHHTTAAQV